jgi:hypothetical protein
MLQRFASDISGCLDKSKCFEIIANRKKVLEPTIGQMETNMRATLIMTTGQVLKLLTFFFIIDKEAK